MLDVFLSLICLVVYLSFSKVRNFISSVFRLLWVNKLYFLKNCFVNGTLRNQQTFSHFHYFFSGSLLFLFLRLSFLFPCPYTFLNCFYFSFPGFNQRRMGSLVCQSSSDGGWDPQGGLSWHCSANPGHSQTRGAPLHLAGWSQTHGYIEFTSPFQPVQVYSCWLLLC